MADAKGHILWASSHKHAHAAARLFGVDERAAASFRFDQKNSRGLGRILMSRTTPPFRADHVGSLLRTAPVKEARQKREKGQITDAQLKEVEDREIEKVIRKQEEIGLKLATDGEFRRMWWHFDFFGML